jgi:FtsP/CotA-like multicopper oxidase with cupredoxin domain
MAGLGVAALTVASPAIPAVGSQARLVRAGPQAIPLRPGGPESPIWTLDGPDLRFRRGDNQEILFSNNLPVATALNWRGIDGAPAAEPLAARRPLAGGGKDAFEIPLRHAGTFFCDLGLLGDGQDRPSRGASLIILESEAVGVDRDEVLVFEDWRLRPDGTAIAAGVDPKGTTPACTVNGLRTLDIPVQAHERLRLRFINGFQRNVIALKIENQDVWVMALDGQPAEPFQARNGAVVLAPGARLDAFIDPTIAPGTTSSILLHDGTEARPMVRLVASTEPPARSAPLGTAPPLPSNGLPARLDLKGALRADLPLGGSPGEWVRPASFTASAAPAFAAKAGRTVVLALTNRADTATVFHLHGHHFRLLDRLDDGWKPFWLDTLAVEAGQTQRIAFVAEHSGRWLLEAMATDWSAPRLVRWYNVA